MILGMFTTLSTTGITMLGERIKQPLTPSHLYNSVENDSLHSDPIYEIWNQLLCGNHLNITNNIPHKVCFNVYT